MEESEEPRKPAPFTPTPIGRGGMRNAWAISKGAQGPLEGTKITKQEMDLRAAANPAVQLPKKAEPPKEELVAPPPLPPGEPKNVQALHELLAKGRPQGLASLANDHMEPPPIKAWAND